jgi:hypothetical protein
MKQTINVKFMGSPFSGPVSTGAFFNPANPNYGT